MTFHFPSTPFVVNSPYKSSFTLLKHKRRGGKTEGKDHSMVIALSPISQI